MSILINRETRLVVQGITGKEGTFHTRQSVAYGTRVVAGVTPGKGGEDLDGLPIFNTVSEAGLYLGNISFAGWAGFVPD